MNSWIIEPVPSTTGAEEYGWIGKFPKMREWVGERVVHGIQTHGYTIKNKPFELTVGVPRSAIEDDSYGVFTPMMTEMGQSAGEFPDELVFTILSRGRAEKCYDGLPFFATTHKVLDEKGKPQSQSNLDDDGNNGNLMLNGNSLNDYQDIKKQTQAASSVVSGDLQVNRESTTAVAGRMRNTLKDAMDRMSQPINKVLADAGSYMLDDRCNAGTGLNGYKDWYIPARDELNLIYRNFKPSFNLNEVSNRAGNANQVGADGLPHGTNAQAVPALGGHTMYVPARTPISPFQEGATQGLTPNTDYGYWSSTFAGSADGSTNAPAAWTENFGGGGQKPTGVNQSVYVRVVRRVKISD